MRLDRDVWKNRLQSIKSPNATAMTEFMNEFRTWKLVSGQGDAEDEEKEEPLDQSVDD